MKKLFEIKNKKIFFKSIQGNQEFNLESLILIKIVQYRLKILRTIASIVIAVLMSFQVENFYPFILPIIVYFHYKSRNSKSYIFLTFFTNDRFQEKFTYKLTTVKSLVEAKQIVKDLDDAITKEGFDKPMFSYDFKLSD